MPVSEFTQWSTALPLISGMPQWVQGIDQQRIAAYQLYEMIYWDVPDALKVIKRGSDTKPILIPSGKGIVETMHRYLAPGLAIIPDPALGSSSEQKLATETWQLFTRRERFYSKFSTNKRYGLIRGDWLFHVVADPERPEGSRISIFNVDPASYFPIYNPDDIDEIIGANLVDLITDDDGEQRIFRLQYRKETGKGGPSPITVQEDIFEIDAWGGPSMEEKRIRSIRPLETLPPDITSIPIYHMPNFAETGTLWGSSEMRGLERLLSAIDQGISDEELTLALDGLGVWVTDAGSPVDPDTKEPTAWRIGPGQVVEVGAGKTFKRESGVDSRSIDAMQSHLKYLHAQLDAAVGQPAIAKGNVSVEVAESGIALMLHMAPILALAAEKEQIVTDVGNNMLFDLAMWFRVYESVDIGEAAWVMTYGDHIPQNRKERFDEIMELASADPPVVSMKWVRVELTKIGFEFPDDTTMMAEILEEKTMVGQIEADVTGARIDKELEDPTLQDVGAGA